MQPKLLQYLFISPVQFLLIAFILIPSLYVGWLSLNNVTFGQANIFVGLQNYQQILTDPNFWRAFRNTFVLVNVVVYVELLLGLLFALFFASGIPFPRVMTAIVLLPYAISEVVAVIIFKYIFDYQVGIANILLSDLGIGRLDWGVSTVHSFIFFALIATWQHLPFTFIILYTSRIGIPSELYEAARLDGASKLAAFRRITLPLLMPAILIALVFRYIFAFRMFSEIWLVTGGGPARQTEVLSVYLYKLGFSFHEFGMASATGWTMLVLSLLISMFYLRAMYRSMFS